MADETEEIRAGLDDRLRALAAELEDALDDAPRGEATRDGVRVVSASVPGGGHFC